MCKNATKTAGALMKAIEPTLTNFLNAVGADTPQAQEALKAFDTAATAVENWTSGTTSADIIQLINAFTAVFNQLPVPPAIQALANIISAGIVTVIGVITANSPAPTAPAGVEADEETQASHAADVAAATEAQVKALVPEFKRSIWHSASSQYTNVWNSTCDTIGRADLKVA